MSEVAAIGTSEKLQSDSGVAGKKIDHANESGQDQDSPSMSTAKAIPLLICSIGNPGSTYANTLHSAGHTVLQSLVDKLSFPKLVKEKTYDNGATSHGYGMNNATWRLWQSSAYMNVSGPSVHKAYKTWSNSAEGIDGKLVILHDELEKPLGTVSVKTNASSAKGHNGLKSIKAAIGGVPLVKVGIGIGRPVSRESEDVAKYVLRKMTANERDVVSKAADEVILKLSQLK